MVIDDGAVLDLRDDLTGLLGDAAEALVQWCVYARQRDPVVFVGAGMSRNAELKAGQRGELPLMWPALDARMKEALPAADQDASIDALWRAELFEQAHGRPRLIDLLRDAIAVDRVGPGDAHNVLMRGPWTDVLTTNFDDLLELASERTGSPWGRAWEDQQLTAARRRSVLHVHGVIDMPDSVVLTLADYRRFAKSKPGILTKVRQLFLERPVLMVGFSATDPNFIQWSGWVEDVVGRNRPPTVSLHVGAVPSASRIAYWSGNLHFVPVDARNLTRVLETINRFLLPPAATEYDDALVEFKRRLEKKARPGQLVDLLWRWWDRLTLARGARAAEYERSLALEATCRRAICLEVPGCTDDVVEGVVQQLRKISLEDHQMAFGSRLPEHAAGLLRHDEKHEKLRHAFGPDWYRLVEGLFKRGLLVPLRPLRAGHTGWSAVWGFRVWSCAYEYAEEAAKASTVDTSKWCKFPKEVNREVRWRETLSRLEESSDPNGIKSFEEEVEGEITPEERASWSAAERLLAWEAGRDVAPPFDPSTAAEWRQVGFFAWVAGDASRTWDAYHRAAEASRSEVEAPDVQHGTLRSALEAGGSLLPSQRSAAAMRDLDLRVRDLNREHGSGASWYEEELHLAEEAELTERQKALGKGPYDTVGSPNWGRGRRAMCWAEKAWLHPGLISPYGKTSSAALWRSSHPIDGLRLAFRYGDETISSLVSYASDYPDPSVRPHDLSAAWSPPSNSPWSLRARARAAAAWLPHAAEGWLPEADALWDQVLVAAESGPEWPSWSESPQRIVGTAQDLVPLTIARWRVSPPSKVMEEWSRVWRLLSMPGEFQELIQGVADLPFVLWVERGAVALESATNFLLAVVQEIDGRGPFVQRVTPYERASLMSLLARCIALHDGAAQFPLLFKAWLEIRPQNLVDFVRFNPSFAKQLPDPDLACLAAGDGPARAAAWGALSELPADRWPAERNQVLLDLATDSALPAQGAAVSWLALEVARALCRLADVEGSRAHDAWWELIAAHPRALRSIGHWSFPPAWLDERARAALRKNLMMTPGSTVDDRRLLYTLWALGNLGRRAASTVIPFLDAIALHLRSSDAAHVARVVGTLSGIGQGLVQDSAKRASPPPEWDRWLMLMRAALADQRTAVRATLAKEMARLLHRPRNDWQAGSLCEFYVELKTDNRLSVVSELRGISRPGKTMAEPPA